MVFAYANLVKKLQKDFKIFVITHNDLLKTKFNHAILIEGDKEKGATAKVTSTWD